MNKNIYCVLGRTAVGKDTLVNELMKRNGMKQVISYSTRPRREGEGDTHLFINKEQVGEFKDIVAYTKIGEYEYFATKRQLEECDFYIIDPIGYKMLSESQYAKEFNFIPVLCVVPKEVEIERSKLRGDNPEVFKKRCAAEDEQFKEFELGYIPHYTINVTHKEKAIEIFEGIIKEKRKDK